MAGLSFPSWLARAVFEGVLIVFAVMLGFLATEWREQRRLEADAYAALDRIVEELESNLAELERVVDYHGEVKEALLEHHNSIADGSAETRGNLMAIVTPLLPRGVQPPLVSEIAWTIASERGELNVIDFDLVSDIAGIYNIQELGVNSTWRMMIQTTFFNETSFTERELAPSLQFLGLGFRELEMQERALIRQYRALIPRVRDLAENRQGKSSSGLEATGD